MATSMKCPDCGEPLNLAQDCVHTHLYPVNEVGLVNFTAEDEVDGPEGASTGEFYYLCSECAGEFEADAIGSDQFALGGERSVPANQLPGA